MANCFDFASRRKQRTDIVLEWEKSADFYESGRNRMISTRFFFNSGSNLLSEMKRFEVIKFVLIFNHFALRRSIPRGSDK